MHIQLTPKPLQAWEQEFWPLCVLKEGVPITFSVDEITYKHVTVF